MTMGNETMKSISLSFCFIATMTLFGCGSTDDELAREGHLDRIREAPASLQSHGVTRVAVRGDGDIVDLTLLSDRGEALGTLSAVKDAASESMEVTLALPGHDLSLAKSKGGAVIKRNGHTVSFSEATAELDIVRELLTK